MKVLKQTREVGIQSINKGLNFDDQNALQSEDYYNLTGLTKDQFPDLITHMSDYDTMRASKTKSARTCVALLSNLVWKSGRSEKFRKMQYLEFPSSYQ
jgi:hypothetical protein